MENVKGPSPYIETNSLFQADIGSPVFLDSAVIGILSRKYFGCFKGVYILTNVLKHLQFINEEKEYSDYLFKLFINNKPLPPRRNRSE